MSACFCRGGPTCCKVVGAAAELAMRRGEDRVFIPFGPAPPPQKLADFVEVEPEIGVVYRIPIETKGFW